MPSYCHSRVGKVSAIYLSLRVETELIVKHPDIVELEELVQQALVNPDEIRRSSRDEGVLLFYLTRRQKRWVVAVARRLNGDGFLITAYQTDAIKEGESIWHR